MHIFIFIHVKLVQATHTKPFDYGRRQKQICDDMERVCVCMCVCAEF